MNWCKPHWDQLRKVIDDKGLSHLVSNSGEEAMAKIASEDPKTFDPLLHTWFLINHTMLQSPGLNGRITQCPMCILVEDGQPELVASWLDGATEETHRYAVEHGHVSKH